MIDFTVAAPRYQHPPDVAESTNCELCPSTCHSIRFRDDWDAYLCDGCTAELEKEMAEEAEAVQEDRERQKNESRF